MNQFGLTAQQKRYFRESIPALKAKGYGDAADIIDGLYRLGGLIVPATFGAANTELAVIHNLGYVPNGYLVIQNSNGGVIYTSTTAATATTIYLKSTVASTAVTLIVF